MMDGITILSVAEQPIVNCQWNTSMTVFLLVMICVFILLSFIIWASNIGFSESIGSTLGAFLICIIIFALFSIPISLTEVGSYSKYKVLIDDTVSITEFNERYKILNQDGLIYTIMEKDADKIEQ